MKTHSTLRIGLFGFGVVGQGLYDVLRQTDSLETEIAHICVKNRSKQRPLDSSLFTYDPLEVLSDASVDLIVELIDDADAAFDIVAQAMKNGKSVVSANKRMIATRLPELLKLQRQTGASFLYEASTGGSIPVIRNLEEYYDNDMLSCVEGIVNGTTNYILSALHASATSDYQSALMDAQRLGFAERDPTLDVDAYDVVYKTAILAAHAYGILIEPSQIVRRGIRSVRPFDVGIAMQQYRTIKLISRAAFEDGRLSVYSMPALVPNTSYLSNVHGEYNAIRLKGAFSDSQVLVGKGAGGTPTASAVLSDIAALRYGYRYEYRKFGGTTSPIIDNSATLKIYARGTSDALAEIPFTQVDVEHRSISEKYMIGDVQLDALSRCNTFEDPNAFLAIVHGG